jgi:hypothetical protein
LPTSGHFAKISTELTQDSVPIVPRVLPGFFFFFFFGREVVVNGLFVIFGQKIQKNPKKNA